MSIELVPVTSQIPKNAREGAEALKGFALACEKALADGWQPGQDVPALVLAAVQHALPILGAAAKIGPEAKADPFGLALALCVSGLETAREVQARQPAEPAVAAATEPSAPPPGDPGIAPA